MDNVEVSNSELLQEIRASRSDLKGVIDAAETRLLLKLEEASRKIRQLEEENKDLRRSVDHLQKAARAKNLIVRGLQVADGESVVTAVVERLGGLLGVELALADLNNAYLIGVPPHRLIKVEFISFLRRSEVLRNSYRLRGTNVFVNPDLTREERVVHKALRDRLKLERSRGVKCYLRGGKLIIEEDILPSLQSTKADDQPNNSRRPDSEPSSLLSTPEVYSNRIFKTHRLVKPVGTITDPDLHRDLAEENVTATAAGGQPGQKTAHTEATKEVNTESRDQRSLRQRNRKGSGSGDQSGR